MNANISYTDLIYLVIDSEATDFERQSLFAAMASDDALQKEFQAALKMHKANETQPLAMPVPNELTNKLFLAAGLTNTNLVAVPVATNWFTIWQISALVLTSIFSIMATLAYQGYNKTEIAVPKQFAQIQSQTSPAYNNRQENQNKLATNNKRKSANTVITNIAASEDLSEVASVNEVSDITNKVVIQKSNERKQVDNYIIESKLTYQNSSEFKSLQNPMQISNPIVLNITPNESGSDFFLDYRGISGMSYFPSRDVSTQSNKSFNNMTFSLNYKLSDKTSFGVEAGQETLPIYEVKADNDFQKYESLIWAGGNITTNLLEIEKFKINSKLTLGGTSLGGLIKPNLLLAYEIKNNVSINAGLEGTMLIYTNNQKILQTTKLALVYGISVGL